MKRLCMFCGKYKASLIIKTRTFTGWVCKGCKEKYKY